MKLSSMTEIFKVSLYLPSLIDKSSHRLVKSKIELDEFRISVMFWRTHIHFDELSCVTSSNLNNIAS